MVASSVLETASPVLTSQDLQLASMDVQLSAREDILPTIQSQPKKSKLSSGVPLPRDPRLRGKVPALLSSSPDLPHKVPVGEEFRHGPLKEELHLHHGHPVVEGELQHEQDPVGNLHLGSVVAGDLCHGLVGELQHDPVGGELKNVTEVENLGEGGVEQSVETSDDGCEKSQGREDWSRPKKRLK